MITFPKKIIAFPVTTTSKYEYESFDQATSKYEYEQEYESFDQATSKYEYESFNQALVSILLPKQNIVQHCKVTTGSNTQWSMIQKICDPKSQV